MSAPVVITFTDHASPAVMTFIGLCTPERLAEFVGPRVTELTQRHMGAYKNARGFTSTHFGEAAASPGMFNPLPNTPSQPNTAAETYSLLKDNIGRPAPKPTLLPPPTTKPSYYEEHRHKPEAPPWLSQPGIHPY